MQYTYFTYYIPIGHQFQCCSKLNCYCKQQYHILHDMPKFYIKKIKNDLTKKYIPNEKIKVCFSNDQTFIIKYHRKDRTSH